MRAVSAFNQWLPQEISFAISIAPPWWQTWWAYALYVLTLLGSFYGAYRLRLHQVQLRQETELKRLQAERLAEVDRMKSRFFSNISHEFRTPLTLILGPLRQAVDKLEDPELIRKLRLVEDNSLKLYGLVNQLLEFSRIEAGSMKLAVAPAEVIQLLRRIVLSFESWAERKRIDLRFESGVDAMTGLLDADKLEKIVNNLISNALKFTPEGGMVIVRLQDHGGREALELSVSDTGPGIAPEHLPHIFDRFYRAEDSHQVEGAGIGLALVSELVALHHGSVFVRSTPGEGSTFTVTLPVTPAAYTIGEIAGPAERLDSIRAAESVPAAPVPAAPVPTAISVPVSPTPEDQPGGDGRPVVLVVEDNTDLRAYIREFLEADYAVLEAKNGRQGLERAFEVIPQLVISDVMMPEMGGIDLCRTIKQDVRTSHVPVLLLTARAGADSRIEGLETGADDYITKPFDVKELLVRVRNLIEQRIQLRKKFSAGVVLKPGEVAVTSLDDALLKIIMGAVETHLGDENLSVERLAYLAGLSRSNLNRKVQALTNLTPVELIRYVRLQRARELLEKRAGSVADIAYQVGFSSPAYFSACFRERFGVQPSQVLSGQ